MLLLYPSTPTLHMHYLLHLQQGTPSPLQSVNVFNTIIDCNVLCRCLDPVAQSSPLAGVFRGIQGQRRLEKFRAHWLLPQLESGRTMHFQNTLVYSASEVCVAYR